MEQKIFDYIGELSKLRDGVPQFLYCSDIRFMGLFRVRSQIYLHNLDVIPEIDFIINSPGGFADEAYKIIRTLQNNAERVNIIVPYWAKSAATLLSLGGTEIIMDEFGEFGPLDVQLAKEKEDSPDYERESALIDEISLQRLEERSLNYYNVMFDNIYKNKEVPIKKGELSVQILDFLQKFYQPVVSQIDPYKVGEKRRKLDVAAEYARRILVAYHSGLDVRQREQLIDYLVNQCPDHGFVVDYNFLSDLPFVKKSNIFGTNYANYLSLLAAELMVVDTDIETNQFVGFVTEKELKADGDNEVSDEPKVKTKSSRKPKKQQAEKAKENGVEKNKMGEKTKKSSVFEVLTNSTDATIRESIRKSREKVHNREIEKVAKASYSNKPA